MAGQQVVSSSQRSRATAQMNDNSMCNGVPGGMMISGEHVIEPKGSMGYA